MTSNQKSAAAQSAARRGRLLAGAALGLLSSLWLVDAAGAAGGTGGRFANGAPGAAATGGAGGSGSGGEGGTVAGPGNFAGGNGGTAYKGVGPFLGTGGGGGGAFTFGANTITGGAGGGTGQAGAPDALGNLGGAAGNNGNGAGAAQIMNTAPVTGGAGGPGDASGGFAGGGSGGPGVFVTGSGANSNTSMITGGAGGAGQTGNNFGGGGGGGAGGFGAVFTAGDVSFVNSGTVSGGVGGAGVSQFNQRAMGAAAVGGGGAGGLGVLFLGGGALFTNNGTVAGGAGGASASPSPNGNMLQASGGGGEGGAGAIFVGDGSSLTNNGMITGGAGGVAASASFTLGGGGGGAGGVGAIFVGNGVVAVNNVTITGGAGGAGTVPIQAMGPFPGSAIGGGGGGGEGGAGIRFTGADASLTNGGVLAGGAGGSAGMALPTGIGGTIGGGGGGDGGAGAMFTGANARFVNSGAVVGGGGGSGAPGLAVIGAPPGFVAPTSGTGGAGGAGVVFSAADAVLTNAGRIAGGNGGMSGGPDAAAGIGGVGVVANGITIDNTGGTIAGGFANGGAGAQAYAIQLNGGTNYVGTGGTITGGIFVAGGSLQPSLPGSRVGTPLAVTGPINFAPGTFYNVRIRPTGNDSLVATGVGTLTGATVNVLAGNGTYRAGTRTILTAGGGLGGTTFSGVTSNLAFLMPMLSYDANNVFLTISGNAGNKIDYGIAAITYNQIAVAGGLTAAAAQHPGGAGGRVLNALNQLTAPQARAAFDSLSGEGITGAQNIAFRSAQLFTSSIFDQTTFYTGGGAANSVTLTERLPGSSTSLLPAFLSLAPTERAPIRELADLPATRVEPAVAVPVANRTWRAWATGWGGTEHISGNAFPIGSATQNNSLYGGSLGVDYQLMPNYLVGVAVGGSNGDFRVDQRGTSGTTTGGHVAFYDLLTLGNWYGASSTSFSYFGNKTTRFVNGFGGLGSETLRGNFDSHEFRTRLEIGRHFASLPTFGALPTFTGFGTVTPFVALEIAELRSNGFNEYAQRGAGNFRLNVSGQSLASAPGFVGFRFQRVTPFGGMVLSPTLQLAYVHEFAPYRNQIGQIISLPGSTFLVDGARPARNAAQVKAGAELALSPRSAIFANFDGEFSGVNQLYAGKGGFRFIW